MNRYKITFTDVHERQQTLFAENHHIAQDVSIALAKYNQIHNEIMQETVKVTDTGTGNYVWVSWNDHKLNL